MSGSPGAWVFLVGRIASLALLLGPLPASAQEDVRHDPSGQGPRNALPTTRVSEEVTAGVVWTGEPGLTETVAQIMDRDAKLPTGALRVRQKPEHRAHLDKTTDATAPIAAWWPAVAESEGALLLPNSHNPQTIGTTFLGIQLNESGLVPPDGTGDAGPTQILVAANGRIKVFDKTGILGGLDTTTDNFFASVGGQANGTSHPHVRFDRLSGRWFVTIIDLASVNHILIAVSSGPTITGQSSFTFFQFKHDDPGGQPNPDTGLFADDGTLGVDALALTIGVNVFSSVSFSNTTAFVVDKADLIGGALTVTAFRALVDFANSVGIYTPQGVHNDDPTAAEGYLVGVDLFFFGRLVARRISDPGGTPSISGDIVLTVPATALPILQVHAGVPSNRRLDALDDRLFAASVHTNKITGGRSLWTAHNFQVGSDGVACGIPGPPPCVNGGRNASRWYEIGNLTGAPNLVQSGTLFDAAVASPLGFWIPSVAASGQGHMALASSRASADATVGFARIAAAGRLRTDALGATQAHTLAQTTSATYLQQQLDGQRWGDYSQMVVDPTDDQTMWTFQEYTNTTNSWAVRVIQLKAPPPATPATTNPSSVALGQASVSVTLTGTSVSGSEFFDPGPDTGGPGFPNHIQATVSGGVTVNSVAFVSPTQVTLSLDTTSGTLGPKDVTITNPDGQMATGLGILNTSCQSITVSENPTPLPNGRVNVMYTTTIFSQTGGIGATTLSLTGTLPTGLAFTPGATGTLSGTPTQAGSFPIIVSAIDQNTCRRDKAYTLLITSTSGTAPIALAVFDFAMDGVLDPTPTDTSVIVAPTWFNNSGGSITPTGTLGSPSAGLSLGPDTAAAYPTIANNAAGPCTNCYDFVSAPGPRPGQHWDATTTETLASPADAKNWTLHVGGSFTDVPTSNAFYRFIETIFHKGVTSGCGANIYCPTNLTLRKQMARFLLRAKLGGGYTSPAPTGTVFGDVPINHPFAADIEDLASRKVTSGCSVSPPLFCPDNSVTRRQMAPFLLRALEGPAFVPAACVTQPFADVPTSDAFCPHIQELKNRQITLGCGGGNYCPSSPVTREQMATLLTRTFGLMLYEP